MAATYQSSWARDLYVVEVDDVARNGKTNNPYGRVFYTKGKS